MPNNNEQCSVLVNQDKRVDIIEQHTKVADLLTSLGCVDSGIAVAVNNQVVTREQWNQLALSHNDQISIFGAIAGG